MTLLEQGGRHVEQRGDARRCLSGVRTDERSGGGTPGRERPPTAPCDRLGASAGERLAADDNRARFRARDAGRGGHASHRWSRWSRRARGGRGDGQDRAARPRGGARRAGRLSDSPSRAWSARAPVPVRRRAHAARGAAARRPRARALGALERACGDGRPAAARRRAARRNAHDDARPQRALAVHGDRRRAACAARRRRRPVGRSSLARGALVSRTADRRAARADRNRGASRAAPGLRPIF